MRILPATLAATLLLAAGCKKDEPPDGRSLYQRACARCHGPDGKGGLPSKPGGAPPRNLTSAQWQDSVTDDQIRQQIRHGRGEMPAFADVFPDAQIDALVTYVRSLRAGAAADGEAKP